MDLAVFQQEHQEWLSRMYPDQPAVVPAAGCVEEAGELLHCVLALERSKIWGDDPRRATQEEMVDAIGDCGIYACSVCDAMGWKFDSIVHEARRVPPFGGIPPLSRAVRLVQLAAGLVAYGEPMQHLVAEYVRELHAICGQHSLDFDECVETTWSAVKLRTRGARKPTVVCLCGSTRFKEAFREANLQETIRGRVVLSVGCYTHSEVTAEAKAALDELHLRKVEMADEVLILNVGGYIGESTSRELAHAQALRKKVRFLENAVAR